MSVKKLLGGLRSRRPNHRAFDELSYIVSSVNTNAVLEEELREAGLAPITDGFAQAKTSDRLFILASGPSINLLSDADWAHVARADSMGFNAFLVHSFKPNLYCMQYNPSVVALLAGMAERFANVPILFRGQKIKSGFFEQVKLDSSMFRAGLYYLREFPVSSHSYVEPRELYSFFENIGLLTHGILPSWTPKPRSTLLLLLLLAYQMGYTEVVLCGADMTETTHFWNDPAAKLMPGIDLPSSEPDPNMLHFSNPRYHPNTLPRYIAEFQEWASERGKFSISVSSASSALASVLPVYDWPG